MRSQAPGPPSKPIVVPSLYPEEGDPVVVRIPPLAMAALAVALVAGGAFLWSRLGKGISLFPQAEETTAVPAASQRPAPARRSVRMYAGATCTECVAARKYLNDTHVPFVEWDVDHDPDARAHWESISAARVLPSFDVGGTPVEGFRPEQLEAALRTPRTN